MTAKRRVVPAHPEPGENWYRDDPVLHAVLTAHVDAPVLDAARDRLDALGHLAPAELDAHARLADRHRPILHRRTPEGERVDAVEFHPSYRVLQRAAREHFTFNLAWHPVGPAEKGPRALAFALGYLFAQAESGYYCPACMTDGAAFVLDRHAPPALRDRYVPRLVSTDPNEGYEGAMYLTEKGGGSDVGGGTGTVAREAEDGGWRLTGEKWFASNCVADVALALARMPGPDGQPVPGSRGLGLFVVPRRLPDGTPNPGVRIERLKEKLGVTSMPTGEVLLEDAFAELVAPAPDGFRHMIEMVNLSRLYNAVASVAVARRALREGQRAGRHREAFGKPVRAHPLFLRKLVELTVDVEGALAFTMDTAVAFDAHAAGDAEAGRALRALTPSAKAVTARLSVRAASEGCEMLGGVGYIEDYVTPRLLRDAQVLPIWEGTTNVQALEFLRAAAKEGSLEALAARSDAALRNTDAPEAAATVRAALADVAEEAARLAKQDPARVEAAGVRLMERAFHAHAAARLLHLAALKDAWASDALRERARIIADLYVARHLSADRDAGERALEDAVLDQGETIAYPEGV